MGGRWPGEGGGRSGWAKETESGSGAGAGAHFGLSPLTSVGLSQSMKVITVTSVDH